MKKSTRSMLAVVRVGIVLIASLEIVACSGMVAQSPTGSMIANANLTSANIPTAGPNVMQVQVGNCGSMGYINEVCASVTICTPGTTACQTINNILVDTGSYGLRIFESVVTVPLTPVVISGSTTLANCATFADGSSDWGPVKLADIQLGSQTAPSVPVHVLSAANNPKGCPNPDTSPTAAGFNGILGVGLFAKDCGVGCTTDASNGSYFACTGTSCVGSTATLAQQVTNPVSMLPKDNNGVLMMLPGLPSGGASAATGALIFGIGTETNNMPNSATRYAADAGGNFVTIFNKQTYSGSFIDSGSNALYFPGGTLVAACGASAPGFYCPANLTDLTAVQQGYDGTNTTTVPFSIMSIADVPNSGAFNDIGGKSTTYFDWGLPFFFGRAVFVGLDAKTSSLGTGPYWAF
jgi:hypothetical protein